MFKFTINSYKSTITVSDIDSGQQTTMCYPRDAINIVIDRDVFFIDDNLYIPTLEVSGGCRVIRIMWGS